jgi:hypothetical protein
VPATGRPRQRNPFLFPGGPSGSPFNVPWPFSSNEPDDDDIDAEPKVTISVYLYQAISITVDEAPRRR